MDDIVWSFLIGLSIGIFFVSMISLMIPDGYAKQLADAICDERFGTEFKSYEVDYNVLVDIITGVNCKSPVKESERYDGLIVKIGGN